MQTISIWNEEYVYKLDEYTAIIDLARFRGLEHIKLTIDVTELKATVVSLNLLAEALKLKHGLTDVVWNFHTYNTSIYAKKVDMYASSWTVDFRDFNDNTEHISSWATTEDRLPTFIKGDPSLLTPNSIYGDVYFSYYLSMYL